jgi:GrpB-like predicted nucleotidyltransferase (UPF0157 family)
VGSTSVPGLAAKPIVDIQVSVADPGGEPRYVPAAGDRPGAAQLGRAAPVSPAARGPATRSARAYLRRGRPVGARPPAVPRLPAAHPGACLQYAEAKRASARRWSDDSWAYTEAKTAVILDVLEQAEEWATAAGWAPQ